MGTCLLAPDANGKTSLSIQYGLIKKGIMCMYFSTKHQDSLSKNPKNMPFWSLKIMQFKLQVSWKKYFLAPMPSTWMKDIM